MKEVRYLVFDKTGVDEDIYEEIVKNFTSNGMEVFGNIGGENILFLSNNTSDSLKKIIAAMDYKSIIKMFNNKTVGDIEFVEEDMWAWLFPITK